MQESRLRKLGEEMHNIKDATITDVYQLCPLNLNAARVL